MPAVLYLAAFAGVAGVLKEGGIFLNIGPETNEKMPDVLDHAWNAGIDELKHMEDNLMQPNQLHG